MPEEVLIKLTLDADGVARGVRLASGELVKLDRASDRTEGRFAGLGGKIGGALRSITALLSVGAVIAYTRRLFELGTAAEETASKFTTVFGAASEAVDRFGQTWAHTAGLTRTEFRGLAADAGAIVRGFGLTGEAAGDFSVDILKLAGDLQSFHNVPIEETFAALRSGLTGEQEPLKRFGILLNEAETKQRAAAVAAREHIGATSAQALALARLELITEKAGVALGDLERTQDSSANTTRRFVAVLRDAEQTMAEGFVGSIQGLMSALNDFGNGDGLSRWASQVGQQLGAVAVALVGTVQGVSALARVLGLLGESGSLTIEALRFIVWLLNSIELATIRAARNVAWMELQFARLRNAADDVRALTKEVYDLNVQIERMSAPGLGRFTGFARIPDLPTAADFSGVLSGLDGILSGLGTPGGGGVAGATEGAGRAANAYTTYLQRQAETMRELARQADDLAANMERLQDGARDIGALRARVEAAEALIDATERHAGQIAALNSGAIQNQRAEAAALARLADAYADAAEAAADLGAWRREESDPALIANIRLQTAERERLAAAYERLVEAAVNLEAVQIQSGKGLIGTENRKGVGDPRAVEDAAERMRNAFEKGDIPLVEVPALMEAGFVRAEEGIAASLGRLSGHIANFAASNQERFGALASGLNTTLGALGSMASDFFEASGQRSEAAFRWQKRIASAQAMVSALTAANNALQDVRPFPLNVAAAGFLLAAGVARVRAINAQQIGGGASGGSANQSSGRQFSSYGVTSGLPTGPGAWGGQQAQPRPVVNVTAPGLTPGTLVAEGVVKGNDLRILVRRADERIESTRGLGTPGAR